MGDGDGLTVGDGVGEGSGLAVGDGVGDGDGLAVGDGVGGTGMVDGLVALGAGAGLAKYLGKHVLPQKQIHFTSYLLAIQHARATAASPTCTGSNGTSWS